jgi:hypothetical protein
VGVGNYLLGGGLPRRLSEVGNIGSHPYETLTL